MKLLIGVICLLLAGCSAPDSSYEASLRILKKYPGAEIIQQEGWGSGFWVRTKDGAILLVYFGGKRGEIALDERQIFGPTK